MLGCSWLWSFLIEPTVKKKKKKEKIRAQIEGLDGGPPNALVINSTSHDFAVSTLPTHLYSYRFDVPTVVFQQ